jgi:PAS domain S-box-containing protein
MADSRIMADRPRRRRWSASDVQEALVISGQIPLWLVDGDDLIAFVNDAAVQLLGYDRDEELIGRPSHDSVHYRHVDGSPFPAEECPITHATLRGEPIRIERDWWVRKDGSMVPISIHCVPLEIDGRMGTAMTFHDQTVSVQVEDERRRLEVERARLGEVRASRARIVEAADEQRRRVVRDLHDGAQAMLVRVVLGLQLALGAGEVPDEVRANVNEALGDARLAIDELRELARGIHPAALTRRGLAAAVKHLAERAPVAVSVEIADDRYPNSVESAAYFVAAEALTNVAKYSGASSARVSASRDAQQFVLTIDDDGIGGAVGSVDGGLAGLSDRLAALDGTLSVSSPPGEGTHIRAEIPLAGLPSTPATIQDERIRDELAERVVRASAPTEPLLAMPGSVLVVDDDAEFRVRAVRLLQSRGYKVVGEASDAASAIDAAASLRPSAMLVDVNLPDRDGYSVAEALKESGIRPRILLTSSDIIDVSPQRLDSCGAVAFVPKTELATVELTGLLR